MKKYVILLCTLFSISLHSQIESITFSNPQVFSNGECSSSDETIFQVDINNVVGAIDQDFWLYMVDGENKVLFGYSSDVGNVGDAGYFDTDADPACGPFKVFATNDGAVISGDFFNGEEIGPFTFDPSLLDSDCPSETCRPIPTLSQWGIIALSMVMLIIGLVGLKQRINIFG